MKNLRSAPFAFLVLVLFSTWIAPLSAQAKPKYASTTVRAIDSTDYVRKSPAPDFWAMIFHYVPQGESMCQTATMAAIFNAMKNGMELSSETKNITQEAIVKKIDDPKWYKAMKEKKCYSLDPYSVLLQRALDLFFGEKKYDLKVVHVDSTEPAAIDKYLEDFKKNEESNQDFIVANFDQAVFTGESESAGHQSPVAAYDRATKRFLILDVDREWYTPYWVPQDQFFKAMNTQDKSAKQMRGYVVVSPHRG